MIVVDSSAVVAILRAEPQAQDLAAALAAADRRLISAANYVELGTVLAGRRTANRAQTQADLDALLEQWEVEIAPVTEADARAALAARIALGQGMGHGGKLNFGDCFAYALAKAHDAPLLFVGDDFTATDVTPAL
jgi:ribonuclease VapC